MSREWRWLFVVVVSLSMGVVAGCSDDSTGDGDGGEADTLDVNDPFDFRPTDGSDEDTSVAPDTSTQDDTELSPECEAGEVVCQDGSTLLVCVDGFYEGQLCLGGEICVEDACVTPTCPTPGQPFGCAEPAAPGEPATQQLICNTSQTGFDTRDCPAGEFCIPATGACSIEPPCDEGARQCRSITQPQVCEGGVWVDDATCDAKTECDDVEGLCVSICEVNNKVASFLGCEYYVIDMDNDGRADALGPATDDLGFGITISNSSFDYTASVTVTGPNTNRAVNIAPRSLQAIDLDPTSDVDDSGIYNNRVFTVTSDVPVTVHQFNPLNGSGVFSNDASLLLPANAYGTHYVALNHEVTIGSSGFCLNGALDYQGGCMTAADCPAGYSCTGACIDSFFGDITGTCSGAGGCGGFDECVMGEDQTVGNAYVDVIATRNNTRVTVTSPVPIVAGNGVGTITPNVPTTFTLNQGQLLHLLAEGLRGNDVSGMVIESADPAGVELRPVAVFSGMRCTNIPLDVPYCDHVEQQLFPTDTWGVEYLATKFKPRGTEDDVWRVLALEDGTTVTLDPVPVGYTSPVTINAGEPLTITTDVNFKITADRPVSVAQFMVGSNYPGIPTHATCGGSGIGDPAYTLVAPRRQFRQDYIVLTPSGYVENYLNIVVEAGRTVRLDDTNLSPSQITASFAGFDLYRLPVAVGVHSLSSNTPFSVTAYGYACDVSYAYPGGLNLIPFEEGN